MLCYACNCKDRFNAVEMVVTSCACHMSAVPYLQTSVGCRGYHHEVRNGVSRADAMTRGLTRRVSVVHCILRAGDRSRCCAFASVHRYREVGKARAMMLATASISTSWCSAEAMMPLFRWSREVYSRRRHHDSGVLITEMYVEGSDSAFKHGLMSLPPS